MPCRRCCRAIGLQPLINDRKRVSTNLRRNGGDFCRHPCREFLPPPFVVRVHLHDECQLADGVMVPLVHACPHPPRWVFLPKGTNRTIPEFRCIFDQPRAEYPDQHPVNNVSKSRLLETLHQQCLIPCLIMAFSNCLKPNET